MVGLFKIWLEEYCALRKIKSPFGSHEPKGDEMKTAKEQFRKLFFLDMEVDVVEPFPGVEARALLANAGQVAVA